ncbi:hypothetical protein R9C00_14220 [Flammeovirgaceae bacterium SG7u.111]|nr:hypothetical protein [Flammeovirgaceae bacterium SG7u.132]WPO38612.1 hypothetical protein R9C00_14220 [Flammeovirgaceae bacterium SG7u.111]
MAKSNTVTDKMEAVRKFIDLTLSAPKELEAAISAGFPKKEFEERLKQFKTIVEKRQEHLVAFGRRKSATKAFSDVKELLWDHTTPLVDFAKNMFEDDFDTYTKLGLGSEREKGYSKMKFQTFLLYSEILKDKSIIDAFAKKKITQAYIEKGMAFYNEMLDLKKFQESAELLRSEEYNEFDEDNAELEAWHRKTKRVIKSWKKIAERLPAEEPAAK